MGANNVRLTQESVLAELSIIAPNLELLSEYKNNNSNLILRCRICGDIFKASLANIRKRKKKCLVCAGKKIIISVAKNRINKRHPSIDVLTNNYINTKQKFHLKCKVCGHEWHCAFKHIENSNGCPMCDRKRQAKERRKDFYVANNEIIDRTNGMLSIAENEFHGTKKPLLVKCSDCGRIYEDRYEKIMCRNIGCLLCDRTTLNVAEANRKKESWLNKIGYLYLIRCWNDNEEFYKVGVTRHSLQNRYSQRNMPYNYEAIQIYGDNLYKITHLENELLKAGRKKNFDVTPNIDFAGRTECFSEEIISIFNEMI